MDIDFLTTTSSEEQIANLDNIACRQTEKKILCGSSTLGRGLCVGSEPECGIRTLDNRTIPDKVVSDEAGAAYGYNVANLGRGCYLNFDELKIDYERIYPDSEVDIVPDNFKLLAYNIWGLAMQEKHRKLFDLRTDFLIQTLDTTNADILCLQEMSAYSYDKLKNWIGSGIDGVGKYKFASEVPYISTHAERNRSVDTYIVAKYRPKRIVTYALPGILGYFNCLSLVEYPNLVIFNIYSQAGGIASPGQENYWIHYSRCRYDLFNMIYDKIRTSYMDQNVVICGDFNCDLDGALPTEGGPKRNVWPELEMINKFKSDLGFIDTFRNLHLDPKSGLTEDTDLNLMRWNQKFKEKMFRYDAIFYKPATNPANTYQITASDIMGLEVTYLSEENSRWFIDTISEKKDLALFKGLKYNGLNPLIPINPSDHFGVITSFTKIPVEQVARPVEQIAKPAKPLEQSGKGYVQNKKFKTKYVLRKKTY